MKFKFVVTVVKDGAVIASSKQEAEEIVSTTMAMFGEGAKISALRMVKHVVPEGKYADSDRRKA